MSSENPKISRKHISSST